ncbi:lipid-binding protein [Siphonobacter sp. BAB-5405]|uniref:YceI family protein n=1 Tax=Siphonobacter sp. BAB-5405 TaxID=1864825 RepID=UPI000C80BE65|nr:YceI family protein [Siphonobacter sp. BAB-5405]PMD97019.1 lipid-binding protein [Siphonobacter sp. BAB-5405]
MKTVKFFAAALAATMLFVNAGKKPTPVKVDTAKSSVIWLGKKVTGEHTGTIALKDGQLLLDGGKLVGGNFTMDMSTLKVTDVKDEKMNTKLKTHLEGEDFFGVANHPTSTMKITKVTPKGGNNYDVTGDLTIKGKTNAVTFPATVDPKTGTGTAKIKIDRSKYDIRYNSKSFFDNLGDKVIYDDFELDVNLATTK